MSAKDSVDIGQRMLDILDSCSPCMCSHYERHLNDLLDWTIECATKKRTSINAACQVRTLRDILKDPARPCWLNKKD